VFDVAIQASIQAPNILKTHMDWNDGTIWHRTAPLGYLPIRLKYPPTAMIRDAF
jgi:hypothetical protein